MKMIATSLSLLATIFVSQAFAADCELPTMPAIPDGSSATMEEMIEGQQALKRFKQQPLNFEIAKTIPWLS